PELDACGSRTLRDGTRDRDIADAALVQLGTQEVLSIDLDSSQTKDSREELSSELLRLRLLGLGQRVNIGGGVVHDNVTPVDDLLPSALRLVLCHRSALSSWPAAAAGASASDYSAPGTDQTAFQR